MNKIIAWIRFHRVEDAAAIGILFLISLFFFAHLFIPTPKLFATAEIGISDIWYFNYPMKNFLSESLKAGELPMWSRHMGGGFPTIAEGQIGAFNLYNLIAFGLLPTPLAFNLGYVLIFFQAALGIYLICRRFALSRPIGVTAGILFAFSGFFVTHISHFILIQAASYLPLLFWATDRLIAKPTIRRLIIFSVLFSQQIFTGFPQLAFITLVGITLYLAYVFITKTYPVRRVIPFVLAVSVGGILSAAQILPTYELLQISNRSGTNVAEALRYSYPFEHVLTFIQPFLFGNPQLGTYPHFNEFKGSLFWENTGYVGIVPLVLALGALFFLRKIKNGYYFVILSGLAFLFMLGGNGPFYFLFTFPPFSFFRFSSRFIVWFLFSLIMLSAFGLTLLQKKSQGKLKHIPLVLMVVSLLNLFAVWYPYHPTVPMQEFQTIPEVAAYLKTIPHGKIYTYEKNARAFAEFFKRGSRETKNYVAYQNELAPNINLLYNITTVDSYASLTPKRISYYNQQLQPSYKLATTSAVLTPTQQRFLNIRNTTHVISPIPLNNQTLGLRKTFALKSTEPENIYLYENTAALPKYYTVTNTQVIETLESFTQKFGSDSFDPGTTVLIEKPANLTEQRVESTIHEVAESHTELQLQTTTDADSILTVTNTYYPGWRAWVDGKETPVFAVNLINQGIELPAGKHTVRFKFESASVAAGLSISIIAYAVLLLLFVIPEKYLKRLERRL